MTPSRRLAAIMFTDMVGSTAAAQLNEAAALKLREEQAELVRSLLAAHQGREIKSMGDGFLVEFDSALRATQCAVEIQRRVSERNAGAPAAPFHLRIGIHLGDVEQQGSDIFGDAVNIASRIQVVGEPGGICISNAVHEQVWNKISEKMEKLPPMELKGLRAPMALYRVVPAWATGGTSSESSRTAGIAVLPFTNISPDPKDEYFADGLTEELITVLSQLRELRVISRTSVMLYKATPKSASQIGAELGVSSILEGSVRKAGNRLRVTAQLIDARSDRHLWAQAYDRELDDVFSVQAEIAKQVAEGLKVELQPAEGAALTTRAPVKSDSYVAYLKGRTLAHQENDAAYKAAKIQFDLAISLDPQNAAAHSGLSDLVRLYGAHSLGMSDNGRQETARRLAERAIELDPNLAEAHASSAVTFWLDWDWAGAEREFQRALSLNPSYSQAHHWYAELLSWQVRIDEALSEWALAEASDPLSPFNLSHFAFLLTWLGKYEEAFAKIQKLGELQPDGRTYHSNLGSYFRIRGETDLYLKEISRLEELESNLVSKRWLRAEYCAFSGEKEKCRSLLLEEQSLPEPGRGPFSFAWMYAALGDVEESMRQLERAVNLPSYIDFHSLRLDPLFEQVRRDPRFEAMLKKVKLA